MAKKPGIKLIANNKKAFHDYFIEDTYEAGIALVGTEVKSLRMGKCSIKESYVRVEQGELFIYGMNISPYEKGNIFNKDPLRVRKLLLHRCEINKIDGKLKEKGLTLVPLKVYFKDILVKVEIGMARGKKLYDKRQDIAKKDQRREAERDFKVKNLYYAARRRYEIFSSVRFAYWETAAFLFSEGRPEGHSGGNRAVCPKIRATGHCHRRGRL